jgi:sulfur-oxidizing protein SoxX
MRRILASALGAVALVMASGAALPQEIGPDAVTFEDITVPAPLTGAQGNAEEGAKAFADRRLGNCLACHSVEALGKEQFHGNVAPPLDGVADRWEPEALRAIVVDAKKVFTEDTIMPGFYSLHVGVNVRKDLEGKTILTAQQVEDIVAFLATLKE